MNNSRTDFLTQENFAPGAIKQRHLVSAPTQKGDVYFGKDGNSFQNLPIGEEGEVIQVHSGVPVWGNGIVTGIAANRPATGPFSGYAYFSTDTFVFSVWTGSVYKSTTLS